MVEDWDTLRLSQAYEDDIANAKKVYANTVVGEFSIPYSYLNYHLTNRLADEHFITEKEFIRIVKLTPDDSSKQLKVEADIYRLVEN
jgi:hypothetical protein